MLAARAVALTPPEAGSALIRRRISIGEYRYHAEDMDAARTALSELVAELPPGELRAEALLWLACVRQAQNGMAEIGNSFTLGPNCILVCHRTVVQSAT